MNIMISNVTNVMNNYPVSNSGTKKEDIQQKLNQSKQVVSDNFESNSVIKAAGGDDKGTTLLLIPPLMAANRIVNKLISGEESKSILTKAGNFGDKISHIFHLDKIISKKNGIKISNFIKNNKFTKYFTNDFKAIPKSSSAKSTSMTEKYLQEIKSAVEKAVENPENAEFFTKGSKYFKEETINFLTDSAAKNINIKEVASDLTKGIDAIIKDKPAADIVRKGEILKEPIILSEISNKLKAANSQIGKTSTGKFMSKGFLKAKDALTFGGGLLGLFFTASSLYNAIKATKEAPKGEKKSTFMHVLSEQYIGIMLFQPSINLLYKAGGNKYRGMTVEGREALKELVKNANSTKITAEGKKALETLLNTTGLNQTLSNSGKSVIDNLIKDTSNSSNLSKQGKKLINGIIKSMKNDASLTPEAKSALQDVIKSLNPDKKVLKEAYQLAKIQKDLLLRGVNKDKVATLAGKSVKEAKTLAKSLKREGAKLSLWERPLKFAGKLLDAGLDTLKSPTAMGKVKNKLKGFGFGLARLLLIMMVIQPLIQKPITKLCHKIFGKPKTYLEKQESKSNKTDEKEPPKNNPISKEENTQNNNEKKETNLLKILSDKKVESQPAVNNKNNNQNNIPNKNVGNTNTITESKQPSIQQNKKQNIVEKHTMNNIQNNKNEEETLPALGIKKDSKKNKEESQYIPSITPYDDSEQEKAIEKQVDLIIKEQDKAINNLKKSLKN